MDVGLPSFNLPTYSQDHACGFFTIPSWEAVPSNYTVTGSMRLEGVSKSQVGC
jgi:hypothetical protein